MNFRYYKRTNLVLTILVSSILLGKLMEFLEPYINQYSLLRQVNDLLGVFSVVGLLWLFLLFIDRVGWKYFIFKWLVDAPNLNGRFKGTLVSNYNSETTLDCVIEIVQTSSKIKLYCYFGNYASGTVSSFSKSHTEEITCEDNGLHIVVYTFKNNSDLYAQFNDHQGAGELSYFKDVNQLRGTYFNYRGNKGKIEVTFISKKLLKRFK